MTSKARITLTRGRGSLADRWEYEVIMPNGPTTCSGWVRGSKREARAAAEEHAREKGLDV
jgi:hypothetical protein